MLAEVALALARNRQRTFESFEILKQFTTAPPPLAGPGSIPPGQGLRAGIGSSFSFVICIVIFIFCIFRSIVVIIIVVVISIIISPFLCSDLNLVLPFGG